MSSYCLVTPCTHLFYFIFHLELGLIINSLIYVTNKMDYFLSMRLCACWLVFYYFTFYVPGVKPPRWHGLAFFSIPLSPSIVTPCSFNSLPHPQSQHQKKGTGEAIDSSRSWTQKFDQSETLRPQSHFQEVILPDFIFRDLKWFQNPLLVLWVQNKQTKKVKNGHLMLIFMRCFWIV